MSRLALMAAPSTCHLVFLRIEQPSASSHHQKEPITTTPPPSSRKRSAARARPGPSPCVTPATGGTSRHPPLPRPPSPARRSRRSRACPRWKRPTRDPCTCPAAKGSTPGMRVGLIGQRLRRRPLRLRHTDERRAEDERDPSDAPHDDCGHLAAPLRRQDQAHLRRLPPSTRTTCRASSNPSAEASIVTSPGLTKSSSSRGVFADVATTDRDAGIGEMFHGPATHQPVRVPGGTGP